MNPVILWGLFAISVPIIIHLLNLRRTKKIEFPTLMFLKEIQQTKYKKIRLKQLLILLCRIGFITALVFAFANPISHGYLGSAGGKLRSTVILVIDDSFSMQAVEKGKSGLETAKDKIRDIYSLFDDKDEIFFTTTSDAVLQKNIKPVSSAEKLNYYLQAVQPTAIPADYNDVITESILLFENSNNPNKEIFVITDGQKNNFEFDKYIIQDPEKEKDVHINFILTTEHTASNISIDTIDVKTKIFEKNKNVYLKCRVNNRNSYNVTGKTLTLYFEGKTIDEKSIDIPAGTAVDVEFSFVPSSTGYRSGFVELTQSNLSDDEINYDNKRYFTIYIPSTVKILISSANGASNVFLKSVLNTVNEYISDSLRINSKYFETKEAGTITDETLKDKELLILNGKVNILDEETKAIEKYLSSGGGLIIYPSPDISTDNYNNFLSALNLPPLSGLNADNPGAGYYFSEINYEHPIIETIFKNIPESKPNLENSPKINNYFILQSGSATKSVIKLNNGNNFLVENNYGKGKILIYAVGPDITFSDFPETSIFTPLTIRSILYASSNPAVSQQVAGKDYFIGVPGIPVKNTPLILEDKIKHSAGDTIAFMQSNSAFYMNMKNLISSTSVYDISSSGMETIEFSANTDKRESEMTIYRENEIKELFKDKIAGINVIKVNQNITGKITEARTGIELWKYFLIATFLFIMMEYVISRSILKAPKQAEVKN